MTRSVTDLRDYLEAIDLCYFRGHLDELGVEIRWMRARGGELTRVGQYLAETRIIEIARPLAAESVPTYYVLGIVHHEACHAIVGPEHDLPFHAQASKFLYSYEVAEWERANAQTPWPRPPKGLR